MIFDISDLTGLERYKLLCAMVVPRPIAFVTSLGPTGVLNAAPFSYFNVMGSATPVLAFGVGDRSAEVPKDTARNIKRQREFVVNMVGEALAEKMNLCATDFPPDVGEVEAVGLTPAPSTRIETPRLAEAPFSFECRHAATVEVGQTRVILGEVLVIHAQEGLVDTERMYVHTEQAHLIGRMHGRGNYARTGDLFQMTRLNYDQWLEQEGEGE